MRKTKVSVELPLPIYDLLQGIAEAAGLTLQEVMIQTIRSGLPPSLAKVPEQYHPELLTLNKLGDRDLLRVVEGDLPPIRKHPTDFKMLYQTYALRLLKWRGHPVPPPFASIAD